MNTDKYFEMFPPWSPRYYTDEELAEHARLAKLIRRLKDQSCANACGKHGCLVSSDERCPLIGEGILDEQRCRYFETSVLPNDRELEVRYWAALDWEEERPERKPTAANLTAGKKRCQACDKAFYPTSNAAKYCSAECRKRVRREKNREAVRRHRKASNM